MKSKTKTAALLLTGTFALGILSLTVVANSVNKSRLMAIAGCSTPNRERTLIINENNRIWITDLVFHCTC